MLKQISMTYRLCYCVSNNDEGAIGHCRTPQHIRIHLFYLLFHSHSTTVPGSHYSIRHSTRNWGVIMSASDWTVDRRHRLMLSCHWSNSNHLLTHSIAFALHFEWQHRSMLTDFHTKMGLEGWPQGALLKSCCNARRRNESCVLSQ